MTSLVVIGLLTVSLLVAFLTVLLVGFLTVVLFRVVISDLVILVLSAVASCGTLLMLLKMLNLLVVPRG